MVGRTPRRWEPRGQAFGPVCGVQGVTDVHHPQRSGHPPTPDPLAGLRLSVFGWNCGLLAEAEAGVTGHGVTAPTVGKHAVSSIEPGIRYGPGPRSEPGIRYSPGVRYAPHPVEVPRPRGARDVSGPHEFVCKRCGHRDVFRGGSLSEYEVAEAWFKNHDCGPD